MSRLNISISTLFFVALAAFFIYVSFETMKVMKDSPDSNFAFQFIQQIPKCLLEIQKHVPFISKFANSIIEGENDVNAKVFTFFLAFIVTFITLFYIIP